MDKVRSHGMNMVSYGMPFGFARGKLSMNKIKSIHFVGIKGVGMTPLAIIAKEAEIKVSGSDTADEFITDVVLKKSRNNSSCRFFKNSHIKSRSCYYNRSAWRI